MTPLKKKLTALKLTALLMDPASVLIIIESTEAGVA
jgi:hypothetical protein